MRFKKILCLVPFLTAIFLLSFPVARTQEVGNVVLRWNQATLLAISNVSISAPVLNRVLAIVHTGIYDAWSAYDPIAVSTTFGSSLRRPASEHTIQNKEEAISFAAYRTLLDLLPSQKDIFDDLMNELGFDVAHTSLDVTTPSGIGNGVAEELLELRHIDGSNQLGDLNEGPYTDYTGYEPVNSPEELTDPNRWQPLTLAGDTVQKFLVPHWDMVTPFALETASQFRPKVPAEFPSKAYKKQAIQIIKLSARLTDKQKAIAEYWASVFDSGDLNSNWSFLAQEVSRRDNNGLDEDVKMFFILTNAMHDASIASWDAKRFYDYVRPITAIQFLFSGKKIKAWGGPGKGTRKINAGDFEPYIFTPPFPEYVSAHSTISAASAEVLKLFTGSNKFGESVIVEAGSSTIEEGTPKKDVVIYWKTFSEAAKEAGFSRRLGGIHFRDADIQGQKLGRKVGKLVFEKAQVFINGTAD
ncbi:MAG: phosphoesterase [Candidatus Melainabacteria bacterium]|nr:phosphoesterase [Candidatus Melainabacteria bacterium]